MDVRNAAVEPTIEHGGTCLSYFLVDKEEMRAATSGSYLERGAARMTIEGEERDVDVGDLVHIPRNAVHSIRPADPESGFRALAFAVSFMPEGATEVVPA